MLKNLSFILSGILFLGALIHGFASISSPQSMITWFWFSSVPRPLFMPILFFFFSGFLSGILLMVGFKAKRKSVEEF